MDSDREVLQGLESGKTYQVQKCIGQGTFGKVFQCQEQGENSDETPLVAKIVSA